MSKIAGELNAEIMKKVIHDRRAKLFAEIVAKTGSKQSVIDRAMQEIESLREQVSKLTKERDIKEHCIVQLEAEDLRMKEQLAALAEQNEKMREALTTCVCAMQDYQAGIGITDMFDRGERIGRNVLLTVEHPDLATPVLNRIRAEG